MIPYVVIKIEKPDIINQEESGKKVSISFEFQLLSWNCEGIYGCAVNVDYTWYVPIHPIIVIVFMRGS